MLPAWPVLCAALAVQAAADAAELEQLRLHKLGLPAVREHGREAQEAAAAAATRQQADRDARAALAALGRSLQQGGDGQGGAAAEGFQAQGEWDEEEWIAVARRHLAGQGPETVPLGRLQLVLQDLQVLRRQQQRAAAADAADAAVAAVEGSRQGDGGRLSSAAGLLASGLLGKGCGASVVSRFMSVEQLRMGDVAAVMQEYARLVASG